MDESGLFYRMGPSRTYLSGSESRKNTRGTEMTKHKERVTVVLACNADGSIFLPVNYIGASKKPRCMRNDRYKSQEERYRSQKNGWMDSKGF